MIPAFNARTEGYLDDEIIPAHSAALDDIQISRIT
jgi:hypothetical protein